MASNWQAFLTHIETPPSAAPSSHVPQSCSSESASPPHAMPGSDPKLLHPGSAPGKKPGCSRFQAEARARISSFCAREALGFQQDHPEDWLGMAALDPQQGLLTVPRDSARTDELPDDGELCHDGARGKRISQWLKGSLSNKVALGCIDDFDEESTDDCLQEEKAESSADGYEEGPRVGPTALEVPKPKGSSRRTNSEDVDMAPLESKLELLKLHRRAGNPSRVARQCGGSRCEAVDMRVLESKLELLRLQRLATSFSVYRQESLMRSPGHLPVTLGGWELGRSTTLAGGCSMRDLGRRRAEVLEGPDDLVSFELTPRKPGCATGDPGRRRSEALEGLEDVEQHKRRGSMTPDGRASLAAYSRPADEPRSKSAEAAELRLPETGGTFALSWKHGGACARGEEDIRSSNADGVELRALESKLELLAIHRQLGALKRQAFLEELESGGHSQRRKSLDSLSTSLLKHRCGLGMRSNPLGQLHRSTSIGRSTTVPLPKRSGADSQQVCLRSWSCKR